MEDSVTKKLIFLLRYNSKNDETKENEKFISLIMNNIIKYKLIVYLYNYLYKNSQEKMINLDYINGKIILRESAKKDSKELYKFNIIEDEKKLCDVKRTNVTINKEESSVSLLKQVHYALDSNIDIMILQTDKYLFDKKGTAREIVSNVLRDEDYKSISYILLKDPSLRSYETIKKEENLLKTYKTILYKDELLENYNSKTEDIKKENVTSYTKNISKYLKALYMGEKEFIDDKQLDNIDIKNLPNYIDLEDNDLVNFFNSINTNGEDNYNNVR